MGKYLPDNPRVAACWGGFAENRRYYTQHTYSTTDILILQLENTLISHLGIILAACGPQGLHYRPQGLHYRSQELHYSPQGLHYDSQGLVYSRLVQGLLYGFQGLHYSLHGLGATL